MSRLLLHEWLRGCLGTFPLGTLVVNLLGCLLFGVCWGMAQGRWTPLVQTAVLVGFLGAFTTFSTFAHDGLQLIEARRWLALMANLLVQNVVGLLAVWGGAALVAGLRGS